MKHPTGKCDICYRDPVPCTSCANDLHEEIKRLQAIERNHNAVLEWVQDNIKLLRYTAEMHRPIPLVLQKMLEGEE